jgi:carbon-monoxide dehydrogenase large subunit
VIGDSLKRIEDPPLLRGTGRFAADISHPGELHMRVVRSPVAHAVLTHVDATRARAVRGVIAVWTFEDVAHLPPIDFRLMPLAELEPYRQPVLARGKVRYVGEPVAVVFAEDAAVAEDAAELVDLSLDTLPPVVRVEPDPADWLSEQDVAWAAPKHAEAGGRTSEGTCLEISYGDLDEAFANAAAVISVDVSVGRHSGVPLECRGLSAFVEATTGMLVVQGGAKVPYWNRDKVAAMLGRTTSSIRWEEGNVGGGFGPRGELYPEDILVAMAAMRLGRPIKWVEDRSEHLVATNHSRDQRHVLRAAVDADGFVRALDAEFWTDQGAYVRTHSAIVSSLTASMLPGPYLVPAYRVRGHVRMTNKTPAGTYRSPGRYEGTFARERLLDRIAFELGLDRLEVRRRNLIPASAMPYRRPMEAMGTELVYDSGNYELLLRRMEEELPLAELRREVAERKASGELVGLGYALFVEKSGLGPVEGARVAIDGTGGVTLTSGVSAVGQGVDTVMAQIVADTLSVDPTAVRIRRGDTSIFPYARGAFATRQSVMAGSASLRAAEAVREKAIAVAAQEWELDPADLQLVDGKVSVVGDPSRSMALGDIAALLRPETSSKYGLEPELASDGWFRTDHMAYPYGCHVAVVRIDEGTGGCHVERYLVGYDVGKALNPMLVHGQLTGGVAQGLGGALFEEFTYNADGQPQATSFMDYMIPTSAEVPDIDVLITEDAPSPLNPLGVKGAGEGGTTAVAAAIASAVDDALSACLVTDHTPITPVVLRDFIKRHRVSEPTNAARSDEKRS